MGGENMLITDYDYDDTSYTIILKYQYTVPGIKKPSKYKIKIAKAGAIELMKTQADDDKKLLEQGFTIRCDYFSLENDYLFTAEFTHRI